MAEFKADAELDIVVPDDQLQSARNQIERELGDIGISVDTGSMAPTGQPRDPATGQFASPLGNEEFERSMMDSADTRNELLQDILDEVEGGGIVGGAGRAGGGGTSIIPVGGVGRGMLTAGGLLAAGAGATVVGAGAFGALEGFRNIGGLENLDRLFSGEFDRGAELPSFAEFAGTGISMLGGPIGMLFSEEITGVIEGMEPPQFPEIDVDDLIENPLSLEPPTIPDNISTTDILNFLPGVGDESTPGPPAGAEGRNEFRQTDPATGRSRAPPAGREGRREFREADRSISVSNDITVQSDVLSRREVERIAKKKGQEAAREIERQFTKGVR